MYTHIPRNDKVKQGKYWDRKVPSEYGKGRGYSTAGTAGLARYQYKRIEVK